MLSTVLSRVFPSQARIHIAPPPLLCMRSRYSCSSQQLSPQQKETIIRSYLSSMFLKKLDRSRADQIFKKDFNGSYRTELINHIRSLKFSNERENDTFEKQIVDSFLSAYEIGKGFQFPEMELQADKRKLIAAGQGQKQLVVFNPTSLSRQLLQDLRCHQQIRIGNYGIGKSFGLRNFQYLSFHRFKLLNDSLLNKAKEEYKKWLQIQIQQHQPGLPSFQNSQKSREDALKQAAQSLTFLPCVIYIQLKQQPSWQSFYFQLQQQFPYITIPFTPKPNQQNLSKKQKEIKRQLMYETMSGNLCTAIRDHFEQLRKKIRIRVVVLIDQTNYYLRSVKQLQYQKKKYQNNNKDNKKWQKEWKQNQCKKTQAYWRAKKISDQIGELKFIGLKRIFYYFSEMAQMQILTKHNIFQQYGFTVIYREKYDGLSKILYYRSGINLATPEGQEQMFLIIGLLLQQALANKLETFGNMNQQELQKTIGELLRQKSKQTRLKISTTYLIAAEIMQNFQKRITNLAKQLSSKDTEGQISAFLDEYLKDLKKEGTLTYFARLRKKVDSALEKQQQKNIAHFFRTLLQAVQMSMLEEKKRKLEALKSEDKKKHSSDVLQEGATNLYQGVLDGTLQGHMYGDEFKGKFMGTVYKGKIVKKDQKGETLREEMLQDFKLKQYTYMELKDVKFDGTFEGHAQQGHLIGSMKGTVDGYRVLASDMQDLWQEQTFTLSFKEIAPFADQFFGLKEMAKFQYVKTIAPDKQSFLQSLTPRALCEVNSDSMTIFQSKNGLFQIIPSVLGNYINKVVSILLQTFAYDQNAFFSQYDKFVTFGLSKLDLTLQIQGEKIKLVNGNNVNEFIHYNSKVKESKDNDSNSQVIDFNERFGQLVERVQKLPQGQGLGARPVTIKAQYSRNSKAIDTVLIYKKTNQQTWFITLDYTLGETSSTINNKIKAHRQFYKNTLQKDFKTYAQKLNFKDRYTHYIVMRDDVYDEVKDKSKEYYQKFIKVSQFRFEFEPQTFSTKVETLPQEAQKMIAAYRFASKLGLKPK